MKLVNLPQEIEIQDSNQRNACDFEVLMDISGEVCALISPVEDQILTLNVSMDSKFDSHLCLLSYLFQNHILSLLPAFSGAVVSEMFWERVSKCWTETDEQKRNCKPVSFVLIWKYSEILFLG